MSIATQQVPTGTWPVDPVHSSVSFGVRHGVGTFRAGFAELDASYDADAGSLTGSVPVRSIDITQPDLRGHVLSPEFFDAERHPEVRFAASEVRRTEDGQVAVPGELTINGVTRPVEARGTIGEPGAGLGGDRRLAIDLTATVDRREFGLNWQAELPGGRLALDWHVRLDVALELSQAA